MKKGFTLVEMLAVILIIAALVVIIMPKFIDSMNKSKLRLYNEQVLRIEEAAELYATKENILGTCNCTSTTISLQNLIDKGYIDSDIKNPKTGKVFQVDKSSVFVQKDGDKIVLEFSIIDGPQDTTGASSPTLVSGLIPVYYDSINSVWKKASAQNNVEKYKWYDYSQQMWANAVTVIPSGVKTRAYYESAKTGTVINNSDIKAFFVWIPRYEYKIPAGSGAREIVTKFVDKLTPKTTGDAITTFRTHPAFTFGAVELSGIWLSKFEATGTIADITSIPNVTSLRSQTIRVVFDSVKSVMQSNANYGFTTDSDIHITKNSEWSSASYLSHSLYGKFGRSDYSNKEVNFNNSSSYYTGRSSGAASGSGVLMPTYEYLSSGSYTYNAKCAYIISYLSPGGCSSGTAGQEMPINVSGLAYGASTTGTIYGLYDMSGGAEERTMSVYKPDVLSGFTDTSGYSTTTTNSQFDLLPDPKYYDRYTATQSASACGGGICYGHGLSEVSTWYGDTNGAFGATSPWSRKSGNYSQGAIAGIFYYSTSAGAAGVTYGFRLALVSAS